MSITIAARTTTKEYHATRTEPATTSRRTDSITMAMQVAPRRNIWTRLEMFSAFAWPQARSSSAGLAAVRMPAQAKILAERSRKEWAASARIATLPVSRPTSNLAPISTTLTRTEYSAAIALSSNRPADATLAIATSPYPYAHHREEAARAARRDQPNASL